MAVVDITGVVASGGPPPDGTLTRVPSAQPFAWARGEDGTIRMSVVAANGGPYDLTGASAVFSVKKKTFDTALLFSRNFTVTDAPGGIATVDILPGDTRLLTEDSRYEFWVDLTGSNATTWRVVPVSELWVLTSVGMAIG